MRVPALVLLALEAAAVVGSGCHGGETASSGARGVAATQQAPAPTTDEYGIPDVIDVRYVGKVVGALLRIEGEVLRESVAAGVITTEGGRLLRAVNTADLYRLELGRYSSRALDGFAGFRTVPGDTELVIESVVRASRSCIVARAKLDVSAAVVSPPETPIDAYVTLRPLDPADDPGGRNPTPWVFAVVVPLAEGADAGEKLCAAT